MSSNPELLGLATGMLFKWRKAPRVDLNCGCPANTVTGNGAGSRYQGYGMDMGTGLDLEWKEYLKYAMVTHYHQG